MIDGLANRGRGMSLAIITEHLLSGWDQLGERDEVHLAIGPEADIDIPDSVVVHRLDFKFGHYPSRLWAQNVLLPRLVRDLKVDALFSVLPSTTVTRLDCPRAIMVLDMRYELRPEQFSHQARWLRKVSYDVGYRQADAMCCISERTKRDLLATHPRLRHRVVQVAYLGADHVDGWPIHPQGEEYAIAFGQFANKNVDLVIDAWTILKGLGEAMPLVIVGLSDPARQSAKERIERLGLVDLVTTLPSLSNPAFHERFAAASLVVFPSDFEGFGLPAVEAMRLGIPVVITPEPALLEVTAGHATVMDDFGSAALAKGVARARHTSEQEIEAARDYVAKFTWKATASQIRGMLADLAATPTFRT
jgi:glycosyltransferase involved in cell wall biosynthesis